MQKVSRSSSDRAKQTFKPATVDFPPGRRELQMRTEEVYVPLRVTVMLLCNWQMFLEFVRVYQVQLARGFSAVSGALLLCKVTQEEVRRSRRLTGRRSGSVQRSVTVPVVINEVSSVLLVMCKSVEDRSCVGTLFCIS